MNAYTTQVAERHKITRLGYVSHRQNQAERQPISSISRALPSATSIVPSVPAVPTENFSQASQALQENEEVFIGEEEIAVTITPQWIKEGKYKPRKPRYFNRVQMGYEWNKAGLPFLEH